jgi:hypothetical protein
MGYFAPYLTEKSAGGCAPVKGLRPGPLPPQLRPGRKGPSPTPPSKYLPRRHFIAFFQYCRPCAGRRRRQWRSRGGTNCRSGFTKEPEAAGQGAPAHVQPPDLLPESPGGSQSGEYTAASCIVPVAGSGSVHCRTGLRTAMATTDRRWKRHTSGACVHRVRQHSGRVAATMQPGGGYRGRPVEERPGKGSRHWLYCRRHCRPAASWCGAVGIGAGTFASASGRACITRTVYDNHHMRRRVVNQALK